MRNFCDRRSGGHGAAAGLGAGSFWAPYIDLLPTTEEVCSENYSKRCFIELSKKSVQETSEKCYYPTERVCNPPSEGEVANINFLGSFKSEI